MIKVIFSNEASNQLDNLITKLFFKNYFSYLEDSKQYVTDLVEFVEKNIATKTKKPAPIYFLKFGKNLQYITYKRNKRTTWYIFFQQKDNKFLVKHITNNHNPKIALRNL
jgi:hypothetical protein